MDGWVMNESEANREEGKPTGRKNLFRLFLEVEEEEGEELRNGRGGGRALFSTTAREYSSSSSFPLLLYLL
jgi:hypothetical protein